MSTTTGPKSATSSGSSTSGRLLIVLASVLWSTNGLFAKSPIFDDWPQDGRGLALAFWRAVFASVVLLPLVRRPRWDWRLVPMSLGFTAMNITFLSSMVLTTAANAIWLQNTAPLWIFCSGLWIYREPFDRRNLVPLVSGLIGAALIVVCEMTYVLTHTSVSGTLLGLASGVFYATVVVSMRRLREDSSTWLIAVNHVVAAAIMAPWVLTHAPWPHGNQWLVLAGFGVIQMGIPYVLFAEGLKRVSSQEGAAVGLLEPVLVPIWVYLAWSETPSWWTIAGGAAILVGLTWRYLRTSRRISIARRDIEMETRVGEGESE